MPTAKAKAKATAVAGLVLGFRFTHSFELIHSLLTANNILFDSIRITGFNSPTFCVACPGRTSLVFQAKDGT
jgi:hypothetical protein